MTIAAYPGHCSRCDALWVPGDNIVRRGDRWLCSNCGGGSDED